jgi:protein-S-isoprenylcysteine O-methyltransferase Ste14
MSGSAQLGVMNGMIRADWHFLVPATCVWVLSLLVTAWDFLQLQGSVYRFGVVNAVGLALFVAGVSLRAIGKGTIAKSYSYVLKAPQGKSLVQHGIYSSIRHPIYLAGLLYNMGTPLIFSSTFGFLMMLGFIPCILYRIEIEERMLIQEFGNDYLEYKKRTRKLIPHVY